MTSERRIAHYVGGFGGFRGFVSANLTGVIARARAPAHRLRARRKKPTKPTKPTRLAAAPCSRMRAVIELAELENRVPEVVDRCRAIERRSETSLAAEVLV